MKANVNGKIDWVKGRQGTGYDKFLIFQAFWPIPWDLYLLRFPTGSCVPPHVDSVESGEHYRLNIILWKAGEGGEFLTEKSIFQTSRIKLFRSDISVHEVTPVVRGTRYVLSFGWIKNKLTYG